MTATTKEQREELARLLDERDSHHRKDDWVTSLAKAEEAQRKAYPLLPALLADAECCAELEVANKTLANELDYAEEENSAWEETFRVESARAEAAEAKLKIAVEALERIDAGVASIYARETSVEALAQIKDK